MKFLRVGDPHCKVSNLRESEALMAFVLSEAVRLNIDVLEILGDLTDTHSIVRLEILEFWDNQFKILSKQSFKTRTLVGNHDLTGDYSKEYSSLHPFLSYENQNFKIIHEPFLDGKYGYLPYIHNNDKFIKEANALAAKGATVLVSHPNYEGAVYDNGTPLANGVSDNSLSPNFLHLIGGHIHTERAYGRIWYTGNPRWLTKSCANKEKGIWLVIHNDQTGAIESKEFISTKSVCTPIVSLVWHEGEEKPEISDNSKTYVELVGSSTWVTKTKKELVGKASVSSKITDIKKSKERKTGKNLHDFLHSHYQTDRREKLIKYMEGTKLLG
jgi:hypothetical protein